MTQQEALAKVSPALSNALGIAEYEVGNVLKLIATASGMGAAPSDDTSAGEIAALKERLAKIEAGEGTDATSLSDLKERLGKLEDQHVALTDSFKALADDIGSASEASAKAAESIEAPKAPEPQPVEAKPPQGSLIGDDSAKAAI